MAGHILTRRQGSILIPVLLFSYRLFHRIFSSFYSSGLRAAARTDRRILRHISYQLVAGVVAYLSVFPVLHFTSFES